MNLKNSPVTQHQFQGHLFSLKRDDLLHGHFNGNKARKFASVLDEPLPGVTRLIGWGSAQANSLTSLAALARIKGLKLTYYVAHKPHWLDDRPMGNYRTALELGAEVLSIADIVGSDAPHPEQYIQTVHGSDPACYIIPEGGRFQAARVGIEQLAKEILSWSRFEKGNNIKVALPSGTGTTALYLSQELKPKGIEVLTCPCVGGKDYLLSQFQELGEYENYPTILELEDKHHFGKLYREDYLIWLSLLQHTDIEFDLLYDPMMWRCLTPWLATNPDTTLMYVHQGGLLGNETMLSRYHRKFGD
ncbi:pyridoxal-phosphate dependent enzyme [Vibrio hangzhouensis]|uniref:1-aminocyclopropane-1-carboxylate deaminase/D-cysteine desulfhydrase, PLP-dependent ACC family n=1 Tax=Vibrio hangzhouensis TaxID=462991 RepID=A0A1H5Z174_9VIBR|nr:pyridoxal-phosphate dependent enzyme [Vibrio hangzhouensis]SEG29156.1 1-aminocyclopropane-1-carboxylate deaminase/D-cysteine desulfhydrase, PLP-dependent ACC family [Vibrio hangzhouensis]